VTVLDLRRHFSRFIATDPDRLHFAAHSHHLWPDVTRDAQLSVWDDAARLIDGKWEEILGPLLDRVKVETARHLALPDTDSLVFAPNTHEFLKRILSCLPTGRPPRILTSDSEFHTFTRQMARLEEEALVVVERVPVEPFATFTERFQAALRGGHDLVFVSEVFFNSGFVHGAMEAIAREAGEAMLVFDGYHGFLARPTDLSAVAHRAFYMSGGYKYAMAGEGVCFLHCPPGWGARPRDTGWYAAFGALSAARTGETAYAETGWRFMGATFDPSGLYRQDAALRFLAERNLDAAAIHAHAIALALRFVDGLPVAGLSRDLLLRDPARDRMGNFLTFRTADAGAIHDRLAAAKIMTDVRADRLRIGFGLYHTAEEVDRLLERLARLA
jgi:kynureninase